MGTDWCGSDSDQVKKETTISEVASIPLPCTRTVGSYNRSHAGTPLHTITAEVAIHFQSMRSSQGKVLAKLIFQGHREVPTMFSWWTNEMTHTHRVPQRKGFWLLMMGILDAVVLYTVSASGLSRWNMLLESLHWPDQQALILVHVALPQHEALLIYKAQYLHLSFKESLLEVTDVFSKQIFNETSNIVGE